jgi:cell division protein FtsB
MAENKIKRIQQWKDIALEKGKKFYKNFFLMSSILFLIWIAFFDSNNFIHQKRLKQKLKDLQEEKAFYQKEIEQMREDLRELNSSPSQLEKFARERYRFKKKGEDVFIIDVKGKTAKKE